MLLESIGQVILFKSEAFLETSTRISYSSCLDVQMHRLPMINPSIIAFKVTGRRKNPDFNREDIGASLYEAFDHTVQFQRICVYDEPTHL